MLQQMNSWTHFLHICFCHISSYQLELVKTLIDNIFSNIYTLSSISGNLTVSISGHLPQFLIVPDTFLNSSLRESNIYERDWDNFDQENFILDYLAMDWADIIKSEKKNIDFPLECFFEEIQFNP